MNWTSILQKMFNSFFFFQALNWKLTPITPNYWLKVYMQLCYQGKSCHELGFTYPQFSPALFSRVSVLMDYASLDIQALNFSYSTIACCCIYLACCSELALHVSGVYIFYYKCFVHLVFFIFTVKNCSCYYNHNLLTIIIILLFL